MFELNPYLDRLYNEARKVLRKAVAPYSKFKVGCAVYTSDHKVFSGCNIENPSLMMNECAERVAIVKAISEGTKEIKAVMIISNKGDYCYPCGSCRQLILEFAPGADIYLYNKKGIKKYTIEELLPHGFKR